MGDRKTFGCCRASSRIYTVNVSLLILTVIVGLFKFCILPCPPILYVLIVGLAGLQGGLD